MKVAAKELQIQRQMPLLINVHFAIAVGVSLPKIKNSKTKLDFENEVLAVKSQLV